jgi:ParB/RepB/Spo0J family partition protein
MKQNEADRHEPRLIEVKCIRASTTNPRTTMDEGALAELMASISAHGILQPLLVRRAPEPNQYEVVCGHRRFEAAKRLGLTHVQAGVRDMDDDQVLFAQIAENIQRADLAPLETAEAFLRLLDKNGGTIDAIASRVNRSRTYVIERLSLLNLTPKAKLALKSGLLSLRVALMLARLRDAKKIDTALTEVLSNGEWIDGARSPMSEHRARAFLLSNFTLAMADAPFDTKSVTLVPKAGSCTDCPKRSGNAPDLFGDTPKQDLCTDPECFNGKRKAHVDATIAQAKAEGTPILDGADAKRYFKRSDPAVSGWVDLDDICYASPKRQTYGKLLGKQTPPIALAVKPDGSLCRLAGADLVTAAMKAKYDWFDSKAARSLPSPEATTERKAEVAKQRLEAKADALAKASVFGAIVVAIDNGSAPLEATAEALLRGALLRSWRDSVKAIAARRGLVAKADPDDKKEPATPQALLRAAMKGQKPQAMIALAVELLLDQEWTYYGADGARSPIDDLCKALGIERKAHLRAAVAALKDKAAGKAPTSTSDVPAKKRERKAGKR